MTPVEQAYEFLTTLTDLAVDAKHDSDSFTLDFEYGTLQVGTQGSRTTISCDFAPALDGVVLEDADFLQTLDAFQAAVLEAVDDVRRLPEGYSYPQDFIYKGTN